jgi:hypothetical protein
MNQLAEGNVCCTWKANFLPFPTKVVEFNYWIEVFFIKSGIGQTDWHVHGMFSLAACGMKLNTGSQTHFQLS